jgi:hypothetical protein
MPSWPKLEEQALSPLIRVKKRKWPRLKGHFRFSPVNGHGRAALPCPKSATNGHTPPQRG